jgi:hypothetical protein
MGYYGVFIGLQYKNARSLTERFDTDVYSGSDAITIEIPITVPYATESPEYQRVDGQFEYQGDMYRMVKQRYSNNTLFLVCVKDNQGKRLTQALKDYVKTFSDKPGDAKSQAKAHVTLIKDYISSSYSINHSSEGWTSVVCNQTMPPVFVDSFCASIVHPPERG